ncbi:hypothetical protein A1O1_05893 [Capronia coronata CBS 617.96]|uniref:Uncharacterized protein n=1 Tax=Capronia coronata CBS 617.96 TaxID=1182541 RepID=W9YTC2_9EURO|nr:uncharacterized protein A1O1_05893 [Capronia coronata CBS 617.96]EXJ85529.1 hypothetical protein A1O1_05893 [Capronia coronata CBS 617.96]
MDDLDLPPVPQSARRAAQTPPRPSFLLSRKRTRADYDDEPPATSSDPAFFSSDEQAPGAENYVVVDKRKKRTYKGSWWERHPVKEGSRHSTRKREFQRNYDSGIFMASEGSEESEEPLSSDSFSMEEELVRDQQRANEKSQTQPHLYGSASGPGQSHGTPRLKFPPHTTPTMPKEHEHVCEIVRQCLETGKEDVDLSSMSLSSLPSEITTLQTLSKQDEIVPGMLDIGTDLEPHLRLYLGNNLFTKVPTPILELRNLRVLSLRQNNLTSIAPGIRELVNLEDLNVAGNNLTELPFEVLELMRFHKLHQLRTEPNPWKRIQPPVEKVLETPLPASHDQRPSPHTQLDFILEGSSQRHNGSDLNVERGFGKVPSLTEMVLRLLAKINVQSKIDLRSFMPPDSPSTVLRDLGILVNQPDRRCTTCRRPIVLAGKEWIEWWVIVDNAQSASAQRRPSLPFRRVQCWHGCRGTKASLPEEPLRQIESLRLESAASVQA